jgi:predicted alpha/beta superfamily hydrolase
LYLTDGDWLFTTAVSAFANLKQDYQVREPIIIAIGYGDRENKRYRDLDPDQGGAAFLRALKEELMAWAQQQFRTHDKPSLYGYSMGGKFSTFALFSEPDLFSSVMIGAPADGGTHLLPTAKKYADHLSAIRAKVFIGAGSYEHETVDHIEKFRLWCSSHVPGATINTYTAPEMNHGAAITAVLQEALRINFSTLQKAITVPVSTLKGYTGVYTSTTDASVSNKVFLQNNQLYILLHGYAKDYALQLHATSGNTFFLKEFEQNRYTFSRAGLRIQLANGNTLEMKKNRLSQ